MKPKKNTPASLRMPDELLEKVEKAMRETGLSQAEVLRLCLAIGLEDLRRAQYDIPSAVVDKAEKANRIVTLAAEDNEPAPAPEQKTGITYPKGKSEVRQGLIPCCGKDRVNNGE
jgi:hypothetical protein